MYHNVEDDASSAQQLKVFRIFDCVGSILTAVRSFSIQILVTKVLSMSWSS